MRKPMWVAALSLVVVLAVAPRNAVAEGFLDLFAGAAFTESKDLKLSVSGFSVRGEGDFDKSFSVGARAGYWFGFFGVNLDVDYFRPSPKSQGRPDGRKARTTLNRHQDQIIKTMDQTGLGATIRAWRDQAGPLPGSGHQPALTGYAGHGTTSGGG